MAVSDTEIRIDFEDLASYRTSYLKSEIFIALGAIFFYAIAGILFDSRHEKDMAPNMWIFVFLGATALLFLFILKRENSWKIKTNNYAPIFIFKQTPNAATVDEFIESIFTARNKYLKETYLEFDKKLNYDDLLKNLKWLKYTEAITKTEFDEKFEELTKMFNRDQKVIGFER